MVVPIVAKKRKEKYQKSLLSRTWPFLLGSAFMGVVTTVITVTVVTAVKLYIYFR